MSRREDLARVLRGRGFYATHSDRWNDEQWQTGLWLDLADAVLSEWLAARLADLGSRLADATYYDDRGVPVVNASQAFSAVARALTPPP